MVGLHPRTRPSVAYLSSISLFSLGCRCSAKPSVVKGGDYTILTGHISYLALIKNIWLKQWVLNFSGGCGPLWIWCKLKNFFSRKFSPWTFTFNFVGILDPPKPFSEPLIKSRWLRDEKKGFHLLSTSYVPGTVLHTWHVLSHLIHTVTLRGRYTYYFTAQGW